MSSDARLGGDGTIGSLENVPAECYDILRHPVRLRLLEVLGCRQTRPSLSELATELAERPTGTPASTRHEVRVSLVHNHLPRLEEFDIVDWDDDGIGLVDDPPVRPADLSVLLEFCERENATTLLETLVDPVRMRLLSVLDGRDPPLSVDALAAQLSGPDSEPFDRPERAKIALSHSHLPAIADIGVISYDHDSRLITQYETEIFVSDSNN
ncbi:DUF7344 domain-containing protein [Natrinema ejinorense]|uniref:Transcriptional regulator n=1 Tax=Natrinema ejinorense TaxID=373386 RepID=A0A2A5QT82_9EURY|nr:helix-turn-helix transcriptional regulator [Natrinema ejinorense]PCR90048.1 transcriptional regulator [Natrinema ejinorense]